MDQNNYNDVVELATPAKRRKVHLLRENNEVPDPYYGDASAFEAVFHLIDTACETLVKEILQWLKLHHWQFFRTFRRNGPLGGTAPFHSPLDRKN